MKGYPEEPTMPDVEMVISVRDLSTGKTTTMTYPRVHNLRMDYLHTPHSVRYAYATYADQTIPSVRTDNPEGILTSFSMLQGWQVQIDQSEDQSKD